MTRTPSAIAELDTRLHGLDASSRLLIDAPAHADGVWWIDAIWGDGTATIDWKQGEGFGLYQDDAAYGERASEKFETVDDLINRLTETPFTGPRILTLKDLYFSSVNAALYGEHRIAQSLPKWVEATSSEEFAAALLERVTHVPLQKARLIEILANASRPSHFGEGLAIDGIVAEADHLATLADRGVVRDLALISAVTVVEGYEISRYGVLVRWADDLGYSHAANALQMTLLKQQGMYAFLTELARSLGNVKFR